ncbi:MAG: HipA domain-containing protein [Alphaproteobacteria bacterium]
MTSEPLKEVYVWCWLAGTTEPVVAGLITRDGERYIFNYGRSYLERQAAIPLYEPELPLRRGAIPPLDGLTLAGCLRDGSPDAWGRRVIINQMFGRNGDAIDVGAVDELTYLIESGSDRVGILDFQRSGSKYEPRLRDGAPLEELLAITERVEQGAPITPELERAVFHGTSLGGARPKAAIKSGDAKFIAKFSSSGDITNVVKSEFFAMRLAVRLGLDVAHTELTRAAGKDVLLIRRFDREKAGTGWARKAVVSALTLLGLDEMMGRYASYQDLAEIIRVRFTSPKKTLREMFGRLVFNVLSGNTDDHARNHAAFWDGKALTLTPAFDICPQNRIGREANQAMLILDEKRMSTLAVCIEAAPHFLLSKKAAIEIVAAQIEGIRAHWAEVAEEASLSDVDKGVLWRRRFLNPYAFQAAPADIAAMDRD